MNLDQRIGKFLNGFTAMGIPSPVEGESRKMATEDIKQLIADVIEHIKPTYIDEDDERARGHNDTLDLINHRVKELGL